MSPLSLTSAYWSCSSWSLTHRITKHIRENMGVNLNNRMQNSEYTLACRGGSRELLAVDVRGTRDGRGCSRAGRRQGKGLNPPEHLGWLSSTDCVRAGGHSCPRCSQGLCDHDGRGVCRRVRMSLRMAELRLCQGLCVGRWLRRWRRWRTMERQGRRSGRAVLQMNVCAV